MSRKAQYKPGDLTRMEDMERRMAMLEDRLRRAQSRQVQGPATATTSVISQTTHGLSVGNVIRHNGTSWTKSQADTAANAVVGGVVIAVLSPDVFVMATGGYVSGLSGLTAGAVHYLSASTAGALVTTQTMSSVLIADTTSSGIINTINTDAHWFRNGTIYSSGSGSFTVPDGCVRLRILLCGAGGGGGGCNEMRVAKTYSVTSGGAVSSRLYRDAPGGSGGGGGFFDLSIDVTAGESIAYAVGGGGSGGAGANNGTGGGASTVTVDTYTISAGGGQGGKWDNGSPANNGYGGYPGIGSFTGRNVTAWGAVGANGDMSTDVVNFGSGTSNNPRGCNGASLANTGWTAWVSGTFVAGGYGGFGSAVSGGTGGNGRDGFVAFMW